MSIENQDKVNNKNQKGDDERSPNIEKEIATEEEPLKMDVELSIALDEKHPELNIKSKNTINSSKSTEKNDSAKSDKRLELYKLEYTTGVRRHDDIYKSLWTNFSYMAILAGGILTFGKEAFPTEVIIAIACVPLIFWFWASFLPLDRYGNKVAYRMAEIEKVLNNTSTIFKNTSDSSTRDGIYLYSDFEGRKEGETTQPEESSSQFWFRKKVRVIHSITVFAILIHLIFIGLFVYSIYNYCIGKYDKQTENETTEQTLGKINGTLGEISNSMKNAENSAQKLESINTTLEQISNSVKKKDPPLQK